MAQRALWSTIHNMKRREAAFLLIGLGFGLIFSVVELALWLRHMFIMRVTLLPASAVLVLPFLFLAIGSMMLYRSKRERN